MPVYEHELIHNLLVRINIIFYGPSFCILINICNYRLLLTFVSNFLWCHDTFALWKTLINITDRTYHYNIHTRFFEWSKKLKRKYIFRHFNTPFSDKFLTSIREPLLNTLFYRPLFKCHANCGSIRQIYSDSSFWDQFDEFNNVCNWESSTTFISSLNKSLFTFECKEL